MINSFAPEAQVWGGLGSQEGACSRMIVRYADMPGCIWTQLVCDYHDQLDWWKLVHMHGQTHDVDLSLELHASHLVTSFVCVNLRFY